MYLPCAHHGIWGPTEPAKSDESKNARFLDSSLGFASFEVPSSTETLTAKCYLLWSLQPAQLPKVCARFGPTPQNPAVPVSAWRLPRHLVLFVSESTRHRQAPEPDGGCTGRSRLGQKLNPRGGTCFAREIGLDDIGPKPPKNPRPPHPQPFMLHVDEQVGHAGRSYSEAATLGGRIQSHLPEGGRRGSGFT